VRLSIATDAAALSEAAAAWMVRAVRGGARLLGLPTGRTPLGLYEALAARRRAGLDLSRVHVVSLDEYLGVGPEEPISLFGWLSRAALVPLGIPPERTLRLPADDVEPQLATRAVDRWLTRHGPMDAVVLGLGPDGHVAFNEPGAPADARTRVVALRRETVERNQRYWEGTARVPAFGMTIGLRDILGARRVLLLAAGAEKAAILSRALEGPITPEVPASVLRRTALTVIADRAAAARLRRGRG
jgi:glucosamine-6-phosphate deaminase